MTSGFWDRPRLAFWRFTSVSANTTSNALMELTRKTESLVTEERQVIRSDSRVLLLHRQRYKP